MDKKYPFVSIIVVNFNGKHFLKECFDSLLALNYPKAGLEILMVDNGSTDGSMEYAKQNYPLIKIIRNDVNNYCRANNLGIKAAKGQYLAFLNNDTRVEKDWLATLVESIQENPNCGVAASKILFPDGRIQSFGHQEYPNFYWSDIAIHQEDRGQCAEEKEIVSFCGCAVLMSRKCLESIGDFDEDFNMFIEDVDMAIRSQKKGWKLITCPKSIVYHKFHGTIGDEEKARYWQELNRLLLIAKHWPDKLSEALSGKEYFTIKNGYLNARDISDTLGKVFAKLIKEHGLEFTNKLSGDLFEAVHKIYNFEKDILINQAIINDRERHALIGKERELLKEAENFNILIKSLHGTIAMKEQEKIMLVKELEAQKQQGSEVKRQLDYEILGLHEAIARREQEKIELGNDLEAQKQQWSDVKRQLDHQASKLYETIARREQEKIELGNELEAQKQKWAQMKQQLGHKRSELDDIYRSTGYRYLLKPLWVFLWFFKKGIGRIKNNCYKGYSDIFSKIGNLNILFSEIPISHRRFQISLGSGLMSRYISSISTLIKKAYLLWVDAKDLTSFLRRDTSPREVYLRHLKYGTFPMLPQRLVLMITGTCNLHCSFCDIPDWRENTKIMSLELALRCIGSAQRLGVKDLFLTGGEPLLHPNLFDIVGDAHSKGMRVSLATNGMFIKSRIDEISKAGFKCISISIDGNEATHDNLRNHKGAFKSTLQGIHVLLQHKIPIAINFVVTNKNIRQLEEMYGYFSFLNIKFIFFPVINKPDLFISKPEERKIYLKFIKKLFLNKDLSKYEYKYLKDALLLYFDQKPLPVRCLGLNDEFGVDVDGNIAPCCVWQNRKEQLCSLGNIGGEDLEKLWLSSQFHKARISIFKEGCFNCFSPSLTEFEKICHLSYLLPKPSTSVRKNKIPPTISKPNHIHFRFTSRCNLTCRHCDIWKKKEDRGELFLEEWKKGIDKLNRWLGRFRLDLAGGEILMYKGALHLIEYAARKGASVNLTTNATLIDEPMAKDLIDSGLHSISLSLDGLDQVHEYLRNKKGLFCQVQKAALNLKNSRKHRLPFISLATVITKYNLDQLAEMLTLPEEWGVDGISFQVLDHNFGADYYDGWFKDSKFWPQDCEKVEVALDHLIQAKISGAKIANSLNQLKQMKEYYKDPDAVSQVRCSSGDTNFIVDESGGIRLCWNMEPIGNILDKNPQDIWQSQEAFLKRKEIANCGRTCRMLNCNYDDSRRQ